MKTPENPTVTNNPKEGNNDHTSHPKDPNNDPDQTPEKEIQDPPKADPKHNEPGKPEKKKIGFTHNNERK